MSSRALAHAARRHSRVLALGLAALAAAAFAAPASATGPMTAAPSTTATVCADVASGCDRTAVDAYDPDMQAYGDDAQAALLTGATRPGTTTNSFTPDTSRGAFTNIDWSTVRDGDGKPMKEGGVVGVDFALGQPGGPALYSPCSNSADPYNSNCMNPGHAGSYMYAKNWYADGSTNFPTGLFIANSFRRSSCAAPCSHLWGQRVARVDVEIYAKKPMLTETVTDTSMVRPRFAQTSAVFTRHANGGTYGPPIGEIRLLRLGQRGTASLKGKVTRGLVPVLEGEASVRLFQQDSTMSSSTGQPLQSFATPNTDILGRYDTGALYAGTYLIRVLDNGSEEVVHGQTRTKCRILRGVSIKSVGSTWNVDLSDNGFGHHMTPC
jgi:hypothetical protein